jgi:hypothetical protein
MVLCAALGCAGGGGATRSANRPGNASSPGPRAAGRQRGPSRVPTPPGAGGVPKPAGAPGDLTILDWAGFKAAITYTFDDAQPSQVEHYADLQATGVRHTFYVTSSSGGFDTAFTQAVKDGHEMGNHTVRHCHADLTGCSNTSSAPASVDAELDDCNSYISTHLGQSAVWTAASPFGDTGWDAPDMTRFFLNRGVGSGTIGPNDNSDPFNLPCHAAVEGEAVTSFNAVIDDVETRARWAIFLVHTIAPTSQSWYAPIDVSVITDSVAHAKSLGDVWIDSMVNVGAYWRGQKLVSAATPVAAGGGQTWTWKRPTGFPTGRVLRVTVDGGALSQNGKTLTWDPHGYYEIALDAGSVTVTP